VTPIAAAVFSSFGSFSGAKLTTARLGASEKRTIYSPAMNFYVNYKTDFPFYRTFRQGCCQSAFGDIMTGL
jgi:uncharacterized protein YcsI (UPF0317 family)